MGAQFEYEIINKSKATREELQKEWDTIVSRCRYESGHGSYSGTLKECSGMQIVNLHFPNFNEAYEWLEGNTQKWEAAKLVSYDDVEKKVTRQITFNGEAAGKSSSQNWKACRFQRLHDLRCVVRNWSESSKIVYADQLTDQKKKMLERELEKYELLNADYEKNKISFRALHANSWKFFDADLPFGLEDWKEMKRLRALLAKTKPKIDKAHAALAERDRKYADSIIKTKTVNNGKKFVVGGWCSC